MSNEQRISIRPSSDGNYEVELRSGPNSFVVMEASSIGHARRVAGSLLMLARRNDAHAPLVLDMSIEPKVH